MKFFFVLLFSMIICLAGFLTWLANSLTFFHVLPASEQAQQSKPSILHLHIVSGFGGGENHSLTLYKYLHAAGYSSLMVIQHDSPMRQELDQLKLPYVTTRVSMIKIVQPLFRMILGYQIKKIFNLQHFDIIQCNTEREVNAAKTVAKELNTRIIFFRHLRSNLNNVASLDKPDAVVAVSKSIEEQLRQIIAANNFAIKKIIFVPPFFRQDPFLHYQPSTLSKNEFFEQQFDITITDAPILCMVANTSPRLDYKNYPLLLRAVAKLIHKRHIPVQVMAVGSGAGKATLEAMSKELKIDHCVHFLGFCKNVTDILHHSDIFVLTSNWEAFGIVYLEAGLMKKPSVGATNTGAQDSIIDGVTGLLFKNNDCDDLIEKLELLIKNPELQKVMGKHAYQNVTHNFLNEKKLKQLEQLYDDFFHS